MNAASSSLSVKIFKFLPGLQLFFNYKREWLAKDIIAGLSVAAIALPIGIAYADLAGLPPVFGLYSSILPMIAYAFFSSSRLLIVSPDSAICMLMAVSLAPFAAVGSNDYISLSIILTLMVGVFCILGGIFRLGFLANFLSKPILNGYLNGLAVSMIVGQFGKLFGFKLEYTGFIRTIIDFSTKLDQTHFLTLVIGISILVFLLFANKFFPRIPATLFAVFGSILIVYLFGFDKQGVKVIGTISAGFISISIPSVSIGDISSLSIDAISIVLIGFCSTILADKSFADKKGYEIDANLGFFSLGVANIFSGLSSGYVVTGSASRTAVADSVGGKTQFTSIMTALTVIVVLLFLTPALSFLPSVCLGAIIIFAGIGLFNFEYLKKLYVINKREFGLAVFTSLSVISIGVIPAILIAVGLSIIGLFARGTMPNDTILGKVEDLDSYQDIKEYKDAKTIPGILIYRFEGSLFFANADYFRKRVRKAISESSYKVQHFLLDASPISLSDSTSVDMLDALKSEMDEKKITFSIARAKKPFKDMMIKSGLAKKIGDENFFFSTERAMEEILKNKKFLK